MIPPSEQLETMEEDAPFFTLHCGVSLHREEDQPELDALHKQNVELEYHCNELRSMASMYASIIFMYLLRLDSLEGLVVQVTGFS